MLTLRDYQQTAIDKITADWQAGYTDVLLTMATGGGKTAVFCALLNQVLTPGKRGLILAHRKELIDQPLARLISYFPDWQDRAGVVMADVHQPDKQLTVATVQTLNASDRRLADILSYGPIDYLVTDEAHHATAETYRNVYAALREANPNMRHLGVTATPIRADGDGLAGVFQKESAHFGIVELIKARYLANVRWLAIAVKISLAGVKSANGDFVKSQLADVFETSECFDLVVKSHKQYAAGRQAVAFTVTVEGAYKLAEAFNAAGISAAAADGTTNKRLRQTILDDFRNGKTDVLCNVGLYTEGLDVPQASCIHAVRPTKSDSLYIQMVGRALRIFPGKVDALILDYAPLEARNIAMMGDVLGVPLRKDAYVKEAQEEPGEVLGGFTFDGQFKYSTDGAEIVARQLDYLQLSPWSWWRDKDGWMSLGLGEASDHVERSLLISPARDGQFELYGIWRKVEEDSRRGRWQCKQIATGDLDIIQAKADELADKWGNASLAAKQRSWRKQPPTDAQLKYATRIGAFRAGMTKGALAQSITHRLARLAVGA